jgi:hypothetical protein
MPDACMFSYDYHRAYVSHFQGDYAAQGVGIIDTKRDTLVRALLANAEYGVYRHVAVDQRDGKAYIAAYPDTMWIVDCATDSVLKKFQCVPYGQIGVCIRWVPWSNRIYLINYVAGGGKLVVVDCNTDSIIVNGMGLGEGYYIRDIQLDPVRQRIFVIGGDSNSVFVLRDTGYAAVETPKVETRVASGLRACMNAGRCDIQYSLPVASQVTLSVYDVTGREVRRLVDGSEPSGEHRAVWNCTDTNGLPVAAGEYFIRLDTPPVRDVQKVVITR